MDELLWLRDQVAEMEETYKEKLASGCYRMADEDYFRDVGSRFQLTQLLEMIRARIKSYHTEETDD